jgi:hypothetical protein
MAEPSITDLQQTIIAQQQELGAMRHAAEQNAISAALHTALSGHEFASAAAGQQVHQLLARNLSVHRDGGALHVTGPGYERAVDYVKNELAKSEYAHFLRTGSRPPEAPRGGPGQGAMPVVPAGSDALPGETMGAYIVRKSQESRSAVQADGRTNPSVSFGLRRTTR